MATQYTTILKLALPVQGELSGTWGDVVNDNITEMVEEAIAGRKVINTWTANSHTLTTADGTTSESRAAILTLTDTGTALTGAGTVICPANSKVYIVENGAGQTITVKTSSGTGVAVPNGENMVVFCDGTNVEQGITNINSLNVTGTVTADGATIDGAITVNGAGINLDDAYSLTWGDGSTQVRGSGASEAIDLRTASTTRINIDADGDVSLYNSAGTSQDFFWDASTSRLGLGETNPSHELHIKSTSPQIRLDDSDGTNTYGDLQYNGVSLNIISRGGASSYGAITFARTDGTNTYNTAQVNASGDFRFYNNTGTSKMRWDASEERLGIGTETPSYDLSVVGSSAAIQIDNTAGSPDQMLMLFQADMGTQDRNFQIKSPTTDSNAAPFRFVTSNSFEFAIDDVSTLALADNKYVGIGDEDPIDRLTVSRLGATWTGVAPNANTTALLHPGTDNATSGSALTIAANASSASSIYFSSDTDNDIGFLSYAHTDNSMQFRANNSERMRITSAGNVGVGTSSPLTLLELEGSSAQLTIDSTNSSYSRVVHQHSGTTLWTTGTRAASDYHIYRESGSGNVIIDYGNVGIGTSSPAVALDVLGSGDATIRVTSTGTGASDDTILRSQIGGTTASNYLYFGDADDNNSGQVRYVHSDDSMRFYAGATTERLRLYSSATIFYNGATEIGRFASNNRFGIGTSVPETNLHVHSTGNTLAQISSSFNGSTTTGLYIDTTGDTSKARLAFQKGGATIGVLGFNHASSATGEGYSFSTSLGTRALLQGDGLRIYNTSSGVSHFFTYNENGGEIQLLDETGTVGTLIDEVSSASRFLQLINGSVVQVGLGSSNTTGNLQFIGGGSEWARFTSDGRLGIANTNPQAQVHAVADGAYTPAYYAQNDGSAASWARMDFYNDQASNTGIIYRDQGGNFAFRNDNSSGTATTTQIIAGNTTAGHITFNTTAASEAMRVESSGEVGIGTATPSSKLHVYHGTSNGIIKVQSNNGYAALQAVASGSNSSYIFFNNGNQETGRIQSANGGIMVFYTNNTQESMRINSTGVLRLEKSIAEHSTALSGSGTVQINYRLGNNFTHTLSGNTTYTFVTPEASGYVSAITLKVTQDSTARTITWPSSVDWAGGTAPTLSTGSGDVDIFVFVTYDGGTTYYGFTAGQDMS